MEQLEVKFMSTILLLWTEAAEEFVKWSGGEFITMALGPSL
jgi:hypothetical protein